MQNELVLAMGERVRSFFKVIDDKWIADLQDFIHQALPKIVVILIFAWVATRILKLVTTRILKVAERHAGGMTKLSQVRTLTSVIRATGFIVGWRSGPARIPLSFVYLVARGLEALVSLTPWRCSKAARLRSRRRTMRVMSIL